MSKVRGLSGIDLGSFGEVCVFGRNLIEDSRSSAVIRMK